MIASDIRVSAILPARPVVFHGRDELVRSAVDLLVAPKTARLALLGLGGIGKTAVALAIVHDERVVSHFSDLRCFISCEDFVDADTVVVALARLLGLPASEDLLECISNHLTKTSYTLLVLDRIEPMWLAGGAPVIAVENLIGTLAQIPGLSLIITCRGTFLPQVVEWSNSGSAVLEPISLMAAFNTFQDRAGRQFAESDQEIVQQLVQAVGRVPLAISLLANLARRGTPISDILQRWDREHISLLCMHRAGDMNDVTESIKGLIGMMRTADESQEPLQLLSLCCTLPEGLHPPVLEQLRPHFKNIGRARDVLVAYGLANLDASRVLRTLNLVRHFVLEHYPAGSAHRDALIAIYLDIAERLPFETDDDYQNRLEVVAEERGNLISVLLALFDSPSQRIVDAVLRFTHSTYYFRPTTILAAGLLPHLEPHPRWMADCLRAIGYIQSMCGQYSPAIGSTAAAAQLYAKLGEPAWATWCNVSAADVHIVLGQYSAAEKLLNETRTSDVERGHQFGIAACNRTLARLMLATGNYAAAVRHVTAARNIFSSLNKTLDEALCCHLLGTIYTSQGDLNADTTELETAILVFEGIGHKYFMARARRDLGAVYCIQCCFTVAEKLLKETSEFFNAASMPVDVATCAYQLGSLRSAQGCRQEALAQYNIALKFYETAGAVVQTSECRQAIKWLDSTVYQLGAAVRQLLLLPLLFFLILIFRTTVL